MSFVLRSLHAPLKRETCHMVQRVHPLPGKNKVSLVNVRHGSGEFSRKRPSKEVWRSDWDSLRLRVKERRELKLIDFKFSLYISHSTHTHTHTHTHTCTHTHTHTHTHLHDVKSSTQATRWPDTVVLQQSTDRCLQLREVSWRLSGACSYIIQATEM